MKTLNLIKPILVAFFISALLYLGGNLFAQEDGRDAPQDAPQPIRIIDKNGRPAGIQLKPVSPEDARKAVDEIRVPGANMPPRPLGDFGLPGIRQFEKLTVIGVDGKELVIDVSDARSVSITSTSSTVIVDGETITETVRKAVIVDADGKTTAYGLPAGGPMPGMLMPRRGMPRVGVVNVPDAESANKFLIGVACSPVPEELAEQMKLATGQGLLVDFVTRGSPASKAGLRRSDVLLYADDTELKSLDDLIRVVEESGSEGRALSLTFLREGKEMGIEVTPVKGLAGQPAVIPRGPIPRDPVPLGGREMIEAAEQGGFRIEVGPNQKGLK